MAQSRFHTPEVLRFATRLSSANTPRELTIIQSRLGTDLYGIRAIVSLPINEPGFFLYLPISFPSTLFKDPIVPYFQHRYFYIIHHELLQLPVLAIDYTITFDTNFASYIESIVRNRSLDGQPPQVKQVIHDILYEDLNFDFIFYFIENTKIAYPIAEKLMNSGCSSPLKFWKSLNRKFRWNIVCLELFRSIDCTQYRKTRTLKFNMNFIEAARMAIEFTFNFYASDNGQLLINQHILPMQRLILFQLLAILRIQFSSNKGSRNKLKQFLSIIQEKCPVFLDRETILAYKYFKNRNDTPILNEINKDGTEKDLWNKVNNLAWDLTAVRIMERMFTMREQGDYMIPFFLSYDKNLRDFIKSFPTKAVIIDRISEGILSIPGLDTKAYLKQEGCGDIISNFSSSDKQRERFIKIRKNPDISLSMIKKEYKSLCSILN